MFFACYSKTCFVAIRVTEAEIELFVAGNSKGVTKASVKILGLDRH